MSKQLEIKGEMRGDVPLLIADYSPAQMFTPQGSKLLSEKLVAEYRSLVEKRSSDVETGACVVWIKASTAGSPLVRALFELYKVVSADSGVLFCASYPQAYMDSLTSLGLTLLPGFKLTTTVEEALQKASGDRQLT